VSWEVHVAYKEKTRNAYKMSFGHPERKITLGRLRRIWEDNIKIELEETSFEYVGRIQLAWDRVQWRAVVNT
jgi:hypothetical protein